MITTHHAHAQTCEGCRSPVEHDDLRCAICARATSRSMVVRERAVARIFRCRGCGAALAYSAEVGAPRCAFCRDVLEVETPRDPVEQADFTIPFVVSPEMAAGALRAWLGSLGFFRPANLAAAAAVEGTTALAWCGWLVDGDAHVTWTADSNAGSGRSDWAPHAGEVSMPFRRLVVPASRGLRQSECNRLVPSYDVRALVPCTPGTSGSQTGIVEQFDVQRSAARAIVVTAVEGECKQRIATDGTIPGSRFRNVHVSVLLSSFRTQRVALPAYVFAYRYGGKVYRAIVHGQDARVAFGNAPYSVAKIVLVVVAALAGLALLLGLVVLAAGSR